MPSDFQRVFSELVRLETELWNAIDARLRSAHELPLSRFEPMQVISRRDSCRVNDIALELAITVGGASKLVDRIEAAGHCRRTPNPRDRRSSIITLTAAGRRLLAEAVETFRGELDLRVGPALPGRSVERFTETLVRLRATVKVVAEREVSLR